MTDEKPFVLYCKYFYTNLLMERLVYGMERVMTKLGDLIRFVSLLLINFEFDRCASQGLSCYE